MTSLRPTRSKTWLLLAVFLVLSAACGQSKSYGDFSDVAYADVDWNLVSELVAECANDQGFPVEASPNNASVYYDLVPLSENAAATEAVDDCEDGLNLPDSEPPTEAQANALYDDLLDAAECLRSIGRTPTKALPRSEVAAALTAGAAAPWDPYSAPIARETDPARQATLAGALYHQCPPP